MITIIDMVTGEIIQSSGVQVEPDEREVYAELTATPMLQEITLQPEQSIDKLPADLATISIERFLRNSR